MCSEIRNNHTKVFVTHKLFSQSRLQSIRIGDYLVYNTILEAIIRELVNDGIIIKQQKEFADDPEDKYEAIQNLDKICKDFRDSGLSY